MMCVLHTTLFLYHLSLCDAMPSFACFGTDCRVLEVVQGPCIHMVSGHLACGSPDVLWNSQGAPHSL